MAPRPPRSAARRSPGPVRVVKFGGSITGVGARLSEAAQRLLEAPGAPWLAVASAPGEITDELLRVLRDSGLPEGHAAALGPVWRAEPVGAELLAAALRARGADVRLLLPDQPLWPLRLQGPGLGAEVDLLATRQRFRRLFRGGAPPAITVMPGFVGVDRRGRPGTLPRGGGDTSAVIAAAALDSEEVTLVKNVPGVLPADPRVVPGSAPLGELSSAELGLLVEGGAPVVAPEALRFQPTGLRIRVVGLSSPLDRPAGTVVRNEREPPSTGLRAPSARKARPPTWSIVTAIPEPRSAPRTRSRPSTAVEPAGTLHAVSWVLDAPGAPAFVRRLVASGAYRAVTQRPYDRPPARRPRAS